MKNKDTILLEQAYLKVIKEEGSFDFVNHKPSFNIEGWIEQNVKNPNGGTIEDPYEFKMGSELDSAIVYLKHLVKQNPSKEIYFKYANKIYKIDKNNLNSEHTSNGYLDFKNFEIDKILNKQLEGNKLKEKVKNVLYSEEGKQKALHNFHGSDVLKNYIEDKINTYDQFVNYYLTKLPVYGTGPISSNSSDDDIIENFAIEVANQIQNRRDRYNDI